MAFTVSTQPNNPELQLYKNIYYEAERSFPITVLV